MVAAIPLNEEVVTILNDKQQMTLNELEVALSGSYGKENVSKALSSMEAENVIASRRIGGILTYYLLQQPETLSRVLIVEDDKNINKLMALSIGKDLQIKQIYDGGEAMKTAREFNTNLVILDLMLPNKDGLDICQTIKSDPGLSDSVVIIVSAMDPTSNRFKGIEYGADYYIKKPFDPNELRNLVTLFLKKKGKRFDPLIDLPDEERISNEIESRIKDGGKYSIGTLKVENLAAYAKRFKEKSAIVILRLVSQLLQDAIKVRGKNVFVGFLNSNEFVIAGMRDEITSAVSEVKSEFNAVTPFILQDEGYKSINLDIESLFESKEVPKLQLKYTETEKGEIIKRREEILKVKGVVSSGDIGAYTYDELQKMLGGEDLDIKITRDGGGIGLHVGKGKNERN